MKGESGEKTRGAPANSALLRLEPVLLHLVGGLQSDVLNIVRLSATRSTSTIRSSRRGEGRRGRKRGENVRPSSSGSATGTAPTSYAQLSLRGSTTITTSGRIRPSTGRRRWSVAPSVSERSRALREREELVCSHYPNPERTSVLTARGHYTFRSSRPPSARAFRTRSDSMTCAIRSRVIGCSTAATSSASRRSSAMRT